MLAIDDNMREKADFLRPFRSGYWETPVVKESFGDNWQRNTRGFEVGK